MFEQPDLSAIVLVLYLLYLPSIKMCVTDQVAYRQQRAVEASLKFNLVPISFLLPSLYTRLKCLKYHISMCANICMNDMMHLLPYTYTVCRPVHWVKAHLRYPTRSLTKSSFYVNTLNSALVVFSGSSTFLTGLVTGKMEPITAITQCWLQLGYILIN